MGCRPSEVARWPADDLRLLEHYLAKQPAPIERVEIAIARLTAIYINAHIGKDAKRLETTDFLPFLDPWADATAEPEPDYAAANKRSLQSLRKLSSRMRPQ